MTTTKPRPRPQRSINVVESAGDYFLLEIVQQYPRSVKTDYYIACEVSASWGRGFRLEKQDGAGTAEVYFTNIDGTEDSCDCRGHTRFGYCKHASGVRALIAAGKVPQKPKPGPVLVPFPTPKPMPRPAANSRFAAETI